MNRQLFTTAMFYRTFRVSWKQISILVLLGFGASASTSSAQWLEQPSRSYWIKPARNAQVQRDTKARDSKAEVRREFGEARGERDDHPEAGMEWFYGQRTEGLGYIPQGAIRKAQSEVAAMRQASGKGKGVQSTAPQWKLVGPNNIGGRINAIAISPSDPKIAYCGAANGGVWKTTDGGTTWAPLTDNMESLAMGSLAIDPNDPNTIYAGTGELAPGVNSYTGYGMLRSTDGGKSWWTIGPSNVAAYSRILVNPKHTNILYAAAGRNGGGIYRSTDKGNSWQQLTAGLASGQVTDMALSMNGDVAVLYAGVATKGLYRSDDGGDNWKPVPFESFVEMRRLQVDVDPKNWKNVVMLSVSSSSNLEGVAKSDDGGETWTRNDNNLVDASIFDVGAGAQGWYDVYMRVDPSNFDHMFVGGLSIWETQDGGDSWQDVALAYRGGMHPDQHVLEFAPSNPSIVYAGNDGGLFTSSDGGSSWSGETAPLAITEFYGIGIDQSQDDLTYGGTQDNGTLNGSSSVDWSGVLGGDGSYTLVDPNNGRVFMATTQGLPVVFQNNNLTQLNSGILSTDTLAWLSPFAIDATHDIVYFGAHSNLYVLPKGATKWTRRAKHLAAATDNTSTIQCIDAFGDGVTLACGTSGGGVFMSTDNGVSFTDVTKGLPNRWVTCVKFNPSDKNTLYATVSGYGAGHIFRTTDKGSSWQNISSNLPDIPVNALAMDPTNASALYIGTDVGVFFSPDGGSVWLPYGTGLPNVAVVYMDIQTKNRVLRVGTHGRSIWEIPLTNDIAGIATPTQRTVWTMGSPATIQWHGFANPVMISVSLDAGKNWIQVVKDRAGTSLSFDSINFAASENALVKISDGSQEVTSALFQIQQQRAGTAMKTVGEYPYYLYDVAYDADDNVLWGTNYSTTDTKIYKIDPDQGTVLGSVDLGGGHINMTGIKYDPKTKHLFIHSGVDPNPAGTSNLWEVTTSGQTIRTLHTPCMYGTGVYVKGDTLFMVDRLTSDINKTLVSDPTTELDPLSFQRTALYGPRGLTWDSKRDIMMLAYTDFQGTNSSNATLEGSYVLFLDPYTGDEKNTYVIQEGASEGVNIRGMEFDPRNGGNTAWITTLNPGAATSAKLVKIALVDGPITTNTGGQGTGAGVQNELAGTTLGQNFPNPFNPSTTIPFTLAAAGNVEFRLLDPMGRVVAVNEDYESAGEHERRLDLSNLSSGTYVYEMRVNGIRIASRKMTLLK